MNNKRLKNQSGISLIEVLLVLAVMAIVVGFAVTQFGKPKDNFQRQNIARELKINLERARFDSVKRRPETDNAMSKVIVESATSFSVYLDLNQDGIVDEDTEKKTVNFGNSNGVKIVGRNLEFPITIKFDRRGHITVDADGNKIAAPTFIVCDKGCTYETANSGNSSKITISATGTVSMTGGGEAGTTFENPTVSSVNPCDKINSWVTVANSSDSIPNCLSTPTPTPTPGASPSPTPGASPTPTASPSPNSTPTPTPTATPTPTPTPTATPLPTPTPTPTPRACTSGQKPSLNNCTCYLPMTVRTNGKCM